MRKTFITTLLVLIGTMAFAQERIAVFPFEDMDNVFTRNEAVLFYREFSNEFTNRSEGRFSVIPRQEVERLINTEAAFQLSDFSARAKTAEMERVLNGTQILSGLIGRVGNNIRITVSLYTYPELEQLPGGATLSVANKNELFDKIPELVRNMQNEIVGGVVPEGLEFEISEGTVIITKYTGNATTVQIPNRIQGFPVKYIATGAFYGCSSLTSITIPSSVTGIGHSAFYGCGSLTSINIPSSVTVIGEGAFYGCRSLTDITVDSRNPAYASINGVLFDKTIRTIITYPSGRRAGTYTIPSSVTTIEHGAFVYCSSLTSISIPSSVTVIGYSAFSGCSSLTSINIPSSVTVIGSESFSGCISLTSINIPSSVTSIGHSAFRNCSSLTSVSIPSSVTSIGDESFKGCINLTNVTIPSSVRNIGNAAFHDCRSLTSITIPSSVTDITPMMFFNCSSLTSVSIPSSVTFIGGGAFAGCSSLTSISIPSQVTVITEWTFAGCSSLARVTIPSSVSTIGYEAFQNCNSLTSVTLSQRTQVEKTAFPTSTRITYRD
jgi:TolB-like protein